jgi:two-component system NtrC family sensor kinase
MSVSIGTSKGAEPGKSVSGQDGAGAHPATKEYYRRLNRFLKIGLLSAFLIPLGILSLYFHVQFNYTIKESSKLHLSTLAESQRNTIDLFLQERVVNIFNLFHSKDFVCPPSEDEMQLFLQHLIEMSDAFVDVGFLDGSGIQVAYAGPFTYLKGKDYSSETWYLALMEGKVNYHISDMYLGFRKKPHFTIAVRQIIDGTPYVMRTTLDPDKFYLFLRSIGRGKSADTFLINRKGIYQVVDPEHGSVLDSSNYKPGTASGSGVEEVKAAHDTDLVAYAWLEEVPWTLVAKQPLSIAYAQMYRFRTIIILVTVVLIVMIVTVIWIVTGRLLRRAQATEESRKELQSQLFHAAKLVSVGELAGGVAHEINNPLAIISAETGVIKDMLDPQFEIEWTPDSIRAELDQIDKAVFRARDITQKLLTIVRKTEPRLAARNVNRLVEDVVSGLMEKELEVSGINLVRSYEPDLPDVLVDPDQIRQVFLNIINNATDAIKEKGTITISTSTSHENGKVRVAIQDTGEGMTVEQMKKVFRPFYTTKEVGKGTGLGLSISLSIVETLGGSIEVQSMPGAGSSFTVVLPAAGTEEKDHA